TVCLVAGLAGSYLLRRRAVRAHQILLLSLIAAAVIPAFSQIVRQRHWGLFVAERTVPEVHLPLPETQTNLTTTIPQRAGDTIVSPSPAVNMPAAGRFEWGQAAMLLWFATSAVLLLRLVIRFWFAWRIVRRSEVVANPRMANRIDAAKDRLEIDVDVIVRSGGNIASPIIWCWGPRPTLLLPKGSCEENDARDWSSVICHELAHWKRRDHVAGLLAELAVCVMPWQLLTWWTRRRLVALSEEACDDWVVASGQTPTRYAKTLLDLLPQNQAGFIPSVVPSRKGLAGRVYRILQDSCGNPCLGRRWAAASVILAVCVILGIALAQTRPAPSGPQSQIDTPVAASEEPPVEGKVVLRIIDPNGQPVLGAKAGAIMQMDPSSRPGDRMRWSSAGASDREGQLVLDAKEVFFPSQRDRSALYILQKRREIGAVQEVARKGLGKGPTTVVLKPVCRVHGTIDSAGLAAIGMPLRGTSMSVRSNNYTLLTGLWTEQNHDFDFLLPPGTYEFEAQGAGGQSEGSPRISAGTDYKVFTVTVRDGQKDLDLQVIDLVPLKLATLIGRPAPEIGPMRGWKHGPGASLADLKGQVVWLHFGGDYPSTSRDLPRLAELHEAFAGKGLTVIAIYNCDSLEELAQRWAEISGQFGGVQDVPFRIAIDGGESTNEQHSGATYAKYGIAGRTANVLIDPAGNVVGQANLFYAKEIVSQMLGVREETSQPDWRKRFNKVYRLAGNEALKRIAPPFIPERMDYYNSEHEQQAKLIPSGPDQMTFRWNWNDQLQNWSMTFGASGKIGSVLNGVIGLKSYEYEGPQSLLAIELPGDWIVQDRGVGQDVKLIAFEELLARELGRTIRFEKRSVERDVIVATGAFSFHPPVGTYENTSVHLYASEADPDESAGGGASDSVGEFLRMLGDRVNMPVIDHTEVAGLEKIPYRHHQSSRVGKIQDEQERAEQLRILLDHLTEQTELRFRIGREEVPVWFITEQTAR
ncbi:MAG: M56 family metallopeptidase, partial [Phycisphaerales bacterium]